jgi:hypothetical protein
MPAIVTARGPLKVVAVIDPAELLDVPVPDGTPRVVLTIRLPDGVVTADLAAKSVRRAIAAVGVTGRFVQNRTLSLPMTGTDGQLRAFQAPIAFRRGFGTGF